MNDPSRTLFPTTRWTVVRSIGGPEPTLRIEAWDEFCRSYRRPLLVWLLARTTPENSEDLVQDFLIKLYEREATVASLAPEKGRLRSYLLTALRNHWLDYLRSTKALRRGAGMVESSDELDHAAAPASEDRLFDHEWAIAILTRTVEILRAEYAARGSQITFDALLPLLESDDAAARRDASRHCRLTDNTFNVALKRLRERLAARLRQEVAATLFAEDDNATDDELRHLIGVLGSNGFGHALKPPA